jgi:two-component system cell cycle response regulator CtrA
MLVLHIGHKPFRRAGDVEAVRQRGIRTERAASIEEAMDYLRLYEFDIALLDFDLPNLNGHDLIRTMRRSGITVPVLAISDAVPPQFRAKALDLGADDFLSSPCDIDELLARMRAIIRRCQGHLNSTLCFGGVEIDMATRDVRVNGARLSLSPREYAILELLFLKQGVILTKGTILNHLYCGADEPEIKTIDVIICRLRKRLAAAGAPALVTTVWGSGYILREAAGVPELGPELEPAWAEQAIAAD